MSIIFMLAIQLGAFAQPIAPALEDCQASVPELAMVEADIVERGERGYQQDSEIDRAKILYDNILLQTAISRCVARAVIDTFGARTSIRDLQNDSAAREQMNALAILNGRLQGDHLKIRSSIDYPVALKIHDLQVEVDYVQNALGDLSIVRLDTTVLEQLNERQRQLASLLNQALIYYELLRPPAIPAP